MAKHPGSHRRPSSKINPTKARKILRDGKVRGKPLSKPQRGLFGAAAGRKKRK